jgi:predicted hotdog family 3-hydroxylacyl-ACP dehydratase
MSGNVLNLDDHRPTLGYVSRDPVLRATSKLPRTADLETRLQALIAAGATDRQLEIYRHGFLIGAEQASV